MKFSFGKFRETNPKVKVFKCWAVTSASASQKTITKVDAWFAENEKWIKVYRLRVVTKRAWLGFPVMARFYVFYKDLPR